MKKFTFKGVLDGFRSSVQAAPRGTEQEIQETLRPDHFQIKKTFRHGFPFSPTALAWDPIQKLLAIGDKGGNLRILGGPGVDSHVRHECGEAVLHARFLVNEGALVTATADDQLHLWTFRQKSPQRLHSLKFQRERITCLHLPLASKWIHVGTERGNVHVVNIETFALSGYVINWNKAIEVTRPNHPGAVVEISDNPLDASKLLIAFETGLVVVWDLRARAVRQRLHAHHAPIKCVALSPREDYYAIGAADGDIKVFSLTTHQLLYTFAGEHARSSFFKHIGQGVTQIHIDNAGRLFSCGADGTMKVRKLPERDSPLPHQPQY